MKKAIIYVTTTVNNTITAMVKYRGYETPINYAISDVVLKFRAFVALREQEEIKDEDSLEFSILYN